MVEKRERKKLFLSPFELWLREVMIHSEIQKLKREREERREKNDNVWEREMERKKERVCSVGLAMLLYLHSLAWKIAGLLCSST